MKVQEARASLRHPVHPLQMGVVFVDIVLFVTGGVGIGDDAAAVLSGGAFPDPERLQEARGRPL